MSERKESIAKIKKAYENGELGFQRGVESCKYYDAETDSHCAVGVLVGKDKSLMNDSGDILNFLNSSYLTVGPAMNELKIETFKGLTIDELRNLQNLHDNLNNISGEVNDANFKNYLYSLE